MGVRFPPLPPGVETVAKVVKAPGCGPGNCGFDSHRSPQVGDCMSKLKPTLEGHVFLHEAAEAVGVHPATLKRWFRKGKVEDVKRDRNDWRIFSQKDLRRIGHYARFTR